MIYGWSPTIGDPDALGWVTVAAYLLTAVLCFTARSGTTRSSRTHAVWTGMTIVLVGLAINKQLDLQSIGTAIARHLARTEGWYDQRRGVQVAFIIAVGVAAAIIAVALALLARGLDQWTNLALTGLLILILFVVVRAASFHHVDTIIGAAYVGVRLNHLLELGGIAAIAAAASGKVQSARSVG